MHHVSAPGRVLRARVRQGVWQVEVQWAGLEAGVDATWPSSKIRDICYARAENVRTKQEAAWLGTMHANSQDAYVCKSDHSVGFGLVVWKQGLIC